MNELEVDPRLTALDRSIYRFLHTTLSGRPDKKGDFTWEQLIQASGIEIAIATVGRSLKALEHIGLVTLKQVLDYEKGRIKFHWIHLEPYEHIYPYELKEGDDAVEWVKKCLPEVFDNFDSVMGKISAIKRSNPSLRENPDPEAGRFKRRKNWIESLKKRAEVMLRSGAKLHDAEWIFDTNTKSSKRVIRFKKSQVRFNSLSNKSCVRITRPLKTDHGKNLDQYQICGSMRQVAGLDRKTRHPDQGFHSYNYNINKNTYPDQISDPFGEVVTGVTPVVRIHGGIPPVPPWVLPSAFSGGPCPPRTPQFSKQVKLPSDNDRSFDLGDFDLENFLDFDPLDRKFRVKEFLIRGFENCGVEKGLVSSLRELRIGKPPSPPFAQELSKSKDRMAERRSERLVRTGAVVSGIKSAASYQPEAKPEVKKREPKVRRANPPTKYEGESQREFEVRRSSTVLNQTYYEACDEFGYVHPSKPDTASLSAWKRFFGRYEMSLEEAQEVVRFIVRNWKAQREEFWMIKQDLSPTPLRMTADSIMTHFLSLKRERDLEREKVKEEAQKAKEQKDMKPSERMARYADILKRRKQEETQVFINEAKKAKAELEKDPDNEELRAHFKKVNKRAWEAKYACRDWIENEYEARKQAAVREAEKEEYYSTNFDPRIAQRVRIIDEEIEESHRKYRKQVEETIRCLWTRRHPNPDVPPAPGLNWNYRDAVWRSIEFCKKEREKHRAFVKKRQEMREHALNYYKEESSND